MVFFRLNLRVTQVVTLSHSTLMHRSPRPHLSINSMIRLHRRRNKALPSIMLLKMCLVLPTTISTFRRLTRSHACVDLTHSRVFCFVKQPLQPVTAQPLPAVASIPPPPSPPAETHSIDDPFGDSSFVMPDTAFPFEEPAPPPAPLSPSQSSQPSQPSQPAEPIRFASESSIETAAMNQSHSRSSSQTSPVVAAPASNFASLLVLPWV